MTRHTYSFSGDFRGQINLLALEEEVAASDISSVLDEIDISRQVIADEITLEFAGPLTSDEQATLDAIVAAKDPRSHCRGTQTKRERVLSSSFHFLQLSS